ncbi:MAG TPA: ABC transporter permease [Candidatus Merdenecus merdavium]|nr:ABC transporter permease [Candidatus Merdenecus merdavium]
MKYMIKKCFTLITTLLIISFITFLAFELIPGDPATSILGTSATPEKLEALRKEMGLNAPFFVRYIDWIKGIFTGDLGISYSYQIPVKEMLGDKILITGYLSALSFIIILLISIPLGILSARYSDTWIDKTFLTVNLSLMAIPEFFIGMILTLIFGGILHFFTPGGFVSMKEGIGGFALYMIYPALAIALPRSAKTIKLLRTSIMEESDKEYVRTARSKGAGKTYVLFHHVLKNAFMPVVTFLGISITEIVASSLIVEQVFSVPGLGRLLITSISGRDYPVVQAIIMIIAIFIMVTNLVVDFIYRLLDPRLP